MPKKVQILTLAALCCGFIVARTQAQENPVIGVLRISSINDVQTSFGGYANAIQPGTSAQMAMLPAMAAMMGVDPADEIVGVLLNPQVSSLPIVLIIPTVGEETIKQNADLGFTPTEQNPKIYTFSVPGSSNKMFGMFVGNKLVASPLQENLGLVVPFVGSDSLTGPLKTGGGQIALGLSVDKLWTAYKPMIDLLVTGATSTMASGTNTAEAALVRGEIDNALKTIGQLQGLAVRISVKPEFANLSVGLTPIPGTELATFFAGGNGPAVRNVSAAFGDSAVVCMSSIKMTPETTAALVDWMNGNYKFLTGDMNTTPGSSELISKTSEWFKAYVEVWDGTFAFGLYPSDQSVFMQGSYGVTDPAKAKDTITKIPDLVNAMTEISKAGGVEMSMKPLDTTQHNGADLFVYSMTNKPVEGSPGATQALAMQEALFLGGENVPIVHALKGNDVIFTQGAGAVEKAKALLDSAASGEPPISPKTYGFAENPALFFAASVPRIMKLAAKSGATKLGNESVAIPATPGIAGAIVLNNSLEFQLSVNSEDIRTAIAMQPQGALGAGDDDAGADDAGGTPDRTDGAPESNE